MLKQGVRVNCIAPGSSIYSQTASDNYAKVSTATFKFKFSPKNSIFIANTEV